jgi:hypothetical protein
MNAGLPLLDPAEEGTCDLCRRFVGGSNLTSLVLREDLWVLTAALCADCQEWTLANGASAWQPEASR